MGAVILNIGRDASNEIRVPDYAGSVGRRHARLIIDSGRMWIEDLGSVNGTFVNGTRIAGPQPISLHDRVALGATNPHVLDLSVAAPYLSGLPSPYVPQQPHPFQPSVGGRASPLSGAPGVVLVLVAVVALLGIVIGVAFAIVHVTERQKQEALTQQAADLRRRAQDEAEARQEAEARELQVVRRAARSFVARSASGWVRENHPVAKAWNPDDARLGEPMRLADGDYSVSAGVAYRGKYVCSGGCWMTYNLVLDGAGRVRSCEKGADQSPGVDAVLPWAAGLIQYMRED